MKHDPLTFGRRLIVDRRRRTARRVAIGASAAALSFGIAALAAAAWLQPGAAAVLVILNVAAMTIAFAAYSEA